MPFLGAYSTAAGVSIGSVRRRRGTAHTASAASTGDLVHGRLPDLSIAGIFKVLDQK
jgi:hypothetical protein